MCLKHGDKLTKVMGCGIKAMLQGSQGVRAKTYMLDYKRIIFFAYFKKSGG